MSSVKSLIMSFVIMMISLIFGFCLSYIFMATELINIEFANSGINDVSPEWQAYDDSIFFINLQYYIGYLIMFLGIAQFVYTATRREETQFNIYG